MKRDFDPILVEVMKHELNAVAEEMAIAISKTGRSSMVKNGDFAVALCDSEGHVIGPCYASPLQMVSFEEVMGSIKAKWGSDFEAGDVLLVNDPYSGSGHMPDVAVASPVVWGGRLVAFTIAYSHHTDAGGRFPGGMSTHAANSYEEGIRIPPVKVYSRGVKNEALLDTLQANLRTPGDWIGDLDAKIAGCRRGEKELCTLLEKYGFESFEVCQQYLSEYAERVVRNAIRDIPDGSYSAQDLFEDDGFGKAAQLPLHVSLVVAGDSLCVDFEGTGPQANSAINVPVGLTKSMAIGALKMIIAPDSMINAGYLRPFEFKVPQGSLLNPRFPGAVGGRAPMMFRVADLVLRALAKALPDKVPVASEGGDVLHFTGRRANQEEFAVMDIFSGGWGGRPTKDGIDGANPMLFGGYGTVPAELLEREFPLVIEGFGFVSDTGGAGQYRGAVSVYRKWRFLEPGHVMLRTNKPGKASEGLSGGTPGADSLNIYIPKDGEPHELPRQTHLHFEVRAGDRLFHATPGSAGFGNPFDRVPAMVLMDVNEGKVSAEVAREVYRVAIDATRGVVDETATVQLRRECVPAATATRKGP